MFNGLIDSTEVRAQRESFSRSLSSSTHCRRMEQDIANERMEQRLRENESTTCRCKGTIGSETWHLLGNKQHCK
jgi:plastocyanin domain-containing protein